MATARSRSASSLPKGWDAATIDLADALALLGLPREVGIHPETGTPITAGIGRYGPFVQHDGTYANLDSAEEVFSVGINRAVSLLAEKRAGGGRRPGGRAAPKALKALGEHPTEGGPVTVRDGRYGPYVNHGKVNATLPKDMAADSVTMETAVELLAAKAGKGAVEAAGEEEAGGEEERGQEGLTLAKKTRERTTKEPRPLPSRDEVLAFVAEHPGKAGKREIARAFGIKGGDKIALKAILKDLSDEGVVESRRGRLKRPGDLPPVTVLEITGRDRDGELIAEPAEWPAEEGDPPKIVIARGRGQGPAPGVGDRVLARALARRRRRRLHRPRHQGPRPEADDRPTASCGRRAAGAQIEPVDRKQRVLTVAADALKGAKEGDLVSVRVTRSADRGPDRAVIDEVVGSMRDEKAVSLIAILAHGIPHEFPPEVLKEAEAAKPAPLKDREDWREMPLLTIDPADAKDHDDAVHAEPDPDKSNPGGFIATVAIADVGWYVRPGSALDREALKRGNSVYFPDRVVPMLPERISNDLCSLREGEDRPALAVRMVFGADGRKRSHRFHRIMMRSAAKLSYREAQDAFDGRPIDARLAGQGCARRAVARL